MSGTIYSREPQADSTIIDRSCFAVCCTTASGPAKYPAHADVANSLLRHVEAFQQSLPGDVLSLNLALQTAQHVTNPVRMSWLVMIMSKTAAPTHL